MKYVFFGTPRFAEIVLKGLIDAGMPPVAIVCNPDRPVGRKQIITPPLTKLLAIKTSSDIDIIQPEKIDEIFMKRLCALEPDFFIVAAYAKILPKAILDIPRLGALGVHPSLLPRYRGASPIQSAILKDEPTTGATIYLMDEKTDHGPIIAQEPLATKAPIGEITYLDLEEQLAELGTRLLIHTIPDFAAGKMTAVAREQNESLATSTKKFITQDGFVAPEDLAVATAVTDVDGGIATDSGAKNAREILQKINALNPEPGAWTMQDGKRIKLLAGEMRGDRLVVTETQKEGEPKPRRS